MKKFYCAILLISISQNLLAQYTLNGSATQDACNAYTLTPDDYNKSGSVWNNNKINLTQSFDFNFDVNLGSHDADGADGIVFVLQPISTSVGTMGGGLGYQGISPAVGVTIDTWQNASDNDPYYDHIAIQLNGDINHASANNVAGPVTAIAGNDNIEDGNWHSLHVIWDAPTKTFTAAVDGILRVSVVKDFVATVFSGNPMVFWGFTGSTGGAKNWQRFRTALNPSFHFSPDQKRCVNDSIYFYDSTISFTTIAKFYWNFGDGSPIDSVHLNPVHVYTVAGDYTITQTVIGADGCVATNTQIVRIGSKPIGGFTSSNDCVATNINFTDTSFVAVGTINKWYWDFGNSSTATSQNPTTTYATSGNKNIKLAVKTLEGCESDTLQKVIHIYSTPVADFTFTDSVCLGSSISFFDNSTAVGDPINLWFWKFSSVISDTSRLQNPVHLFTTPGNQIVSLQVSEDGTTGCATTITKNVFVVNKPIAYFKTNTICQTVANVFTDSSYTSDGVAINQWWWNLGNGSLSIQQNPSIVYNNFGTDTIVLVVHNSKGCASDTLKQPIIINAKPNANFGLSSPICFSMPVQFSDSSLVNGGTLNNWSWIYNGIEWSTIQNPSRTFGLGFQTVKLAVTSNAGCLSDTSSKTFFVNPIPQVTINFNDACLNNPVNFNAVDNTGTVTQWRWVFGDGNISLAKDTQHIYPIAGTYHVKLYAITANGCYSDLLQKNIIIYSTNAFAGNVIIAAAGEPIQLNATGGISYLWTPAIGLSDINIADPIATVNTDQTYTVKAFTPVGCETYANVLIKIYKGPDIYLPNAFTPNGDGLNDVLKAFPVGIKQFNFLKIYNRWGQQIFYTSDYSKGWDGTWNGQKQESGVYVVIANGIDFRGNVINKRSTVLLIR